MKKTDCRKTSRLRSTLVNTTREELIKMSVNNLQSTDQLHFYLKSNGIDINDFRFFKDDKKNKFGIDGIKPLENPYLWNMIVNKNLIEPIRFLIEYKKEWISSRVVTAILTGNPYGTSEDCLIPRNEIVALLRALKENDKDIAFHMEDIMLYVCPCCVKSSRVLQILMTFTKNNDIVIRPNGSFMREILSEASKIGNIDLLEMIIGYFPEALKECGDWPFLNAIKHGCYELAVYLVHKGLDPHCKRDMGYKLIQSNDKKNIPCFAKNKEAHDYLVSLYKKDKKD